MFFTLATLALAFASTASAHATIYSAWVNGNDQGDGQSKYIRSPKGSEYNFPVRDLTSPDVVCNKNGAQAVPEFVKAAAGDKLAFQWFHARPNDPSDFVLDKSHLGALLTYIAPYTETDVAGPIWSKLAHAGYENGEWATLKLIANGGKVEFTLPQSLKKGKYLIRQEIVALHMADKRPDEEAGRGPEFYPGCVQVDVTEGGDAVPDQNFDFNSGYKYTDPGFDFNVHFPEVPYDSYKPPGPEVWSG